MRRQFEDLLDEMKHIKETGHQSVEKRQEMLLAKKRIKKPIIRPDYSRSLFVIPMDARDDDD